MHLFENGSALLQVAASSGRTHSENQISTTETTRWNISVLLRATPRSFSWHKAATDTMTPPVFTLQIKIQTTIHCWKWICWGFVLFEHKNDVWVLFFLTFLVTITTLTTWLKLECDLSQHLRNWSWLSNFLCVTSNHPHILLFWNFYSNLTLVYP